MRREAAKIKNDTSPLPPESAAQTLSDRESALLHELQVHQIELELQNESLRQALVDLEESRDRYIDLYDFSPLGYLTLDSAAMVREINLTGATLLGEVRTKLLNRPFDHWVMPAERGCWNALFDAATVHGGRSSGELRLCRDDGTVLEAQLECLRAQDGEGLPGVRIALTDIGERKQAEAARRDIEARYRAIIHHTLDGVVLAEVGSRRLCSANASFLRMTGYGEDEIDALRVDDIHPAADLPWIVKIFERQARGEIAVGENMPVLRRDGSVFYADVNTAQLVLNDRQYLLGQFRDVTDRRRTEIQLRRLAMELTLAEERERRIITENLHDDLGQVLAIAKLRLSSLECPRKCERHEGVMRQVKAVEDMIDGANRSVRSLGMQLSPPTLSSFGLLCALEWLAEEMLRAHDVRVSVHDDGKTPLLNGTLGGLLFRAVRELLLNVAKHARVNAVDVLLAMDGEMLVISVADDGCGFDPQQSPTPSPSGGYGLFSVRERLNLLGGGMQIDSRPGNGTLVVLNLPSAAQWDGAAP